MDYNRIFKKLNYSLIINEQFLGVWAYDFLNYFQ